MRMREITPTPERDSECVRMSAARRSLGSPVFATPDLAGVPSEGMCQSTDVRTKRTMT